MTKQKQETISPTITANIFSLLLGFYLFYSTCHCFTSVGAGVGSPALAFCPAPSQNWNSKLETQSSQCAPQHPTQVFLGRAGIPQAPAELRCFAVILIHAFLCHWFHLLTSHQAIFRPAAALTYSVIFLHIYLEY